MNLRELQKLLKNCTEADINFDEPHISLRCQENNLTKEKVVYILLHETERLYNFIEDRSRVYKLYFKLTNKRQLDVIIDLFTPKKLMIRNIKILDISKEFLKDLEDAKMVIDKRNNNCQIVFIVLKTHNDIKKIPLPTTIAS